MKLSYFCIIIILKTRKGLMLMIPKSLKQPLLPTELIILRSLSKRMNLPTSYKTKINRSLKGYQGEKKFFNLLKKQLPSNATIVNNLRLIHDGNEFQIDSLLISEDCIYLFEIKNYEGDFIVNNDQWFIFKDQNEIRNPLPQIERNEFFFRKFIKQLGYNFPTKSYLIFINNKFTLYNTPLNNSIIYSTQVNRFINSLKANSFKLKNNHQKLLSQLSSRHLTTSNHFQLPKYEFDNLKKGILCSHCHEFLSCFNRYNLKCKKCQNKIKIENAILQSVTEYNHLFPNENITTNTIYKWCNIIKSKKTIRRILSKNFKKVGYGRHAYYIKPD